MKVVIDLENTISNASHRLWMLKGKKLPSMISEYYNDLFQRAFQEDSVNEDVSLFIESLIKSGYEIVILTAKENHYCDIVVDWLERFNVKYDWLIMKPETHEFTSDLDFKEHYVRKHSNDIALALDDVGENCAMFNRYNIPCLRIVQK